MHDDARAFGGTDSDSLPYWPQMPHRRKPAILVVCGPPCSGKSFVSRVLGADPAFELFCSLEMDDVRVALGLPNSSEDRGRAYARMHELAAEALRRGAPGVILNATYQPGIQRRAVQVLAAQMGADVYLFECQVDPREAVARFLGRTEAHAADDLSAWKVFDLSHEDEYCYFDRATRILTADIADISRVFSRRLSDPNTPAEVEAWIELRGRPLSRRSTQGDAQKLNERSRLRARRDWRLRLLVAIVSTIVWCVSLMVFAKTAADPLIGRYAFRLPPEAVSILRHFTYGGNPAEWIVVWLGLGGLAVGVFAVWDTFVESVRAKLVKSVALAGTVPRFDLTESPPSNPELYRQYCRRLPAGDRDARMLVPGVALWFLIPPKARGFDVKIQRVAKRKELDVALLTQRAAKVGLSWRDFVAWRTKQKEDQYYNTWHETGLRVLDAQDYSTHVTLRACKGSYISYVCTELASNFSAAGRYGFTMREILEGEQWRAWERSPKVLEADGAATRQLDHLDLKDLGRAADTFEMLVGVQVALTTSDDFLVLQRRSDKVQSAAGGAGASAAGGAKWKDGSWRDWKWRRGKGLAAAALRETWEEIRWRPSRADDTASPFLGAAFSLLRGRDLNFYCHFHTEKKLNDIRASRARDAWEVAHLIPVPIEAVLQDGKLEPRFDSFLGDARHLRGLLYCLAKSDKFLARQKAARKKWGQTRLDAKPAQPGTPSEQ